MHHILRAVLATVSARGRATTLAVLVTGLVCAAPLIAPADPGPAPTLLWERRPGTVEYDAGAAVAVDSLGSIVVGGWTLGSLGRLNQGFHDGLVIKYSAEGLVEWRRQPATRDTDRVTGITTDAQDNIIAVGSTWGSMAGRKLGEQDCFIVKYRSDGTQLWKRQFGTADRDETSRIATDAAGNIVVVGFLDYNAAVIKYAADGTEQWRRVLESGDFDIVNGVAIDALGNIVVVGETLGSLGGPNQGSYDLFVAVYSPDGTLLWIKQPGTTDADMAIDVAIGAAGEIFVVGQQYVHGLGQGMLAAFSADGAEQWRVFTGKAAYDLRAAAIDSDGGILVVGSVFVNHAKAGVAASYTSAGTLRWIQQRPRIDGFGQMDIATGTDDETVFVSETSVSRSRGFGDGYVAKYVLP